MDNEEIDYRSILESWGYDIVEETFRPWSFWVKSDEHGRHLRCINVRDEIEKIKEAQGKSNAPFVIHDDNFVGNNKFRYNKYGDKRHEPICIQDYADDKGRKYWKDYVIVKDKMGNVIMEGPKPFRSKKERTEYENVTGQRQREKGEKDPRS